MSYSRDAQALALSHGAEESATDALRQRETLLQILTEANIEHDICEDVVDACEISNLNALALASGLMDTAIVAELCYLTTDEADIVIKNCQHKAFELGVTFGRSQVVSPRRLATFNKAAPEFESPQKPKVTIADSDCLSDSLPFDRRSPRHSVRHTDAPPSPLRKIDASRSPALSADPAPLTPPPVAKPMAAGGTPASRSTPGSAAVSRTKPAPKSSGYGAAAPRSRSATGQRARSSSRPGTSAASATPSPNLTPEVASAVSAAAGCRSMGGMAAYPANGMKPQSMSAAPSRSGGAVFSGPAASQPVMTAAEIASEQRLDAAFGANARGRSLPGALHTPAPAKMPALSEPETAAAAPAPAYATPVAAGSRSASRAGGSPPSSAVAVDSSEVAPELVLEDGAAAAPNPPTAAPAPVTAPAIDDTVPVIDPGLVQSPTAEPEVSQYAEVDGDVDIEAESTCFLPEVSMPIGGLASSPPTAAPRPPAAPAPAAPPSPATQPQTSPSNGSTHMPEEPADLQAQPSEVLSVPGGFGSRMFVPGADAPSVPQLKDDAADAPQPTIEAFKMSEPSVAEPQSSAGAASMPQLSSDAASMPSVPQPSADAASVPQPSAHAAGVPQPSSADAASAAPSAPQSGGQLAAERLTGPMRSHKLTNGASAPQSPKTPHDGVPNAASTRDLTVESGQLNTGSTATMAAPEASAAPAPAPAAPAVQRPGLAYQRSQAPQSIGKATPLSPRVPPLHLTQSPPASGNRPVLSMSPRSAGPRPRTPPARGHSFTASATKSPRGDFGIDEIGSTFLKYPGEMPSFMRPTTATAMRTQWQPAPAKQSPRPRSTRHVAPNAHFLLSTESVAARSTPGPESSAASVASRTPPTTRFQPFRLSQGPRSHTKAKTTEEIRMDELKSRKAQEAAQRRRLLQRTQTSPHVLPHASSPRITKPKPFRLHGAVLSEQDKMARNEAVRREEQDKRRAQQFRARPYDPNRYRDIGMRQPASERAPYGSRQPASDRSTASAPRLASGDRVEYRRNVLETRFSAARDERQERAQETRAAREMKEREEAERLRKLHTFHARPVPKSVRRGSTPTPLTAPVQKPLTTPEAYPLSGSRIPHLSPASGRRSSSGVVVSPNGRDTVFARTLRA